MEQEESGGGLLGYGYGEGDSRVSALRDMLDGGGRGQAGETFQGGPLSGLLNFVGVRPYGYRDTMDAGGYGMSAPMGGGAGYTAAPMPMPNVMGSGMNPSNAYAPYQPPMGSGMNPANAYAPYQSYMGSGMNPANVYVPFSEELRNLYMQAPSMPPAAMSVAPRSVQPPARRAVPAPSGLLPRGYEGMMTGA